MKRILVFALLVVFCFLSLDARDKESKQSSELRHAWGTPLTMEEFASDKPLRDTSDFLLTWKIVYERESRRKGLTKVTYLQSKLYFDEKNSWIDAPCRNDNVLRFCQLAFDYAELYRRKEYEEWASGNWDDYSELVMKYRDKRNENIRVARSLTRCGEDTTAIRFYEKELERELKEMQDVDQFDYLDQYVGNCVGSFHASFGPYVECGQNDYFDKGKTVGLSMRCGFEAYNHLFLLDFCGSVTDGKCKRPSGKIKYGEAISTTAAWFTYGYCTTPQARNRLFTTASIGKRSFISQVKSEKKSDAKSPSCYGVDLGFGFLYEIPIHQCFMFDRTYQSIRQVMMFSGSPHSSGALASMHCLYIRPQFNVYHIKQSSAWYPAASLSIGYCWSLRGYERKR